MKTITFCILDRHQVDFTEQEINNIKGNSILKLYFKLYGFSTIYFTENTINGIKSDISVDILTDIFKDVLLFIKDKSHHIETSSRHLEYFQMILKKLAPSVVFSVHHNFIKKILKFYLFDGNLRRYNLIDSEYFNYNKFYENADKIIVELYKETAQDVVMLYNKNTFKISTKMQDVDNSCFKTLLTLVCCENKKNNLIEEFYKYTAGIVANSLNIDAEDAVNQYFKQEDSDDEEIFMSKLTKLTKPMRKINKYAFADDSEVDEVDEIDEVGEIDTIIKDDDSMSDENYRNVLKIINNNFNQELTSDDEEVIKTKKYDFFDEDD